MVTPNSHPLDVIGFACRNREAGAALVVVTQVRGGSVRAPGVRMAVAQDGDCIGYVSNGCIDADVIAHARKAIETGAPVKVSYGNGQDNIDLRLPCGGRIDLLIVPVTDEEPLRRAVSLLAGRKTITLAVEPHGSILCGEDGQPVPGGGWCFTIRPKIRLCVSGIGSETVILAALARAADMEVLVQSPDAATIDLASGSGFETQRFSGLSSDAPLSGDALTAQALMFHDHEWEVKLLTQALRSEAFYVGALGSVRAHEARREALRAVGLTDGELDRLKAPIGLIPRLRDPHLLAVSVVAEIVAEFQKRYGSF